ncbi:accessory Sec system glycosyltransferase GtfA [Macrococcoides goetzii]|uniref:UDP-N-acetylglucosamine--peptide N-acetylglucosaminyltransferase GtfA subunit n=1 Tax=Macrococcoides goetzii TaxID=1891097 RepID=A0A2G5NWB6_9STAP|nr:accessory Sec system glycosyltransferase GtfA [Macrococcus goetzii]RAI78915.1 accessory Sec system glycosyltransferase GtfA [Macrococcus goetzii]
MTIYNINFGIGWASSGVEYAQSYRAKLLRSGKQAAKFIFLDFIQNENIQTLTSNLGFKDKEIIWLYQHFTNIKIAPTSYTVQNIVDTLTDEVTRVEENGKVKRLFFKNDQTFVTCYLKEAGTDIVDRAEFVSNGMLIRKDFYSYVRILSEFYAPHDNKAKAYMRQFYNEDGTVAYEEYLDEEKESIFMIDHTPLYGKRAFVAYFLKSLKLTKDDILIIDRSTNIGQTVLENKGDSKVGVVVHAEHFSKNAVTDDTILWNNYYEYQFAQADAVDFFITATDRQNEILSAQFKQYTKHTPRIRTIPVGALDKLTKPKSKRRPYSVVSASRLANEKHIDWLTRAVIKAKKELPELTFDIYGEGGEKQKIQQIIEEHHASDYIQMKGHVDLTDIYKNYELFLSASQSEGFGLSLLEAIGSGLGMIGFDVNYGNPTFIKDGENGILIPDKLTEASIEVLTDHIAEAIVKFYQLDLKQVEKASYSIAEPFKKQHVKQRWLDLIEEVKK